jgi:hypothetical protein
MDVHRHRVEMALDLDHVQHRLRHHWSQRSRTAMSSTLLSEPWSIRSRNCLVVLNCAAVAGCRRRCG